MVILQPTDEIAQEHIGEKLCGNKGKRAQT